MSGYQTANIKNTYKWPHNVCFNTVKVMIMGGTGTGMFQYAYHGCRRLWSCGVIVSHYVLQNIVSDQCLIL